LLYLTLAIICIESFIFSLVETVFEKIALRILINYTMLSKISHNLFRKEENNLFSAEITLFYILNLNIIVKQAKENREEKIMVETNWLQISLFGIFSWID